MHISFFSFQIMRRKSHFHRRKNPCTWTNISISAHFHSIILSRFMMLQRIFHTHKKIWNFFFDGTFCASFNSLYPQIYYVWYKLVSWFFSTLICLEFFYYIRRRRRHDDEWELLKISWRSFEKFRGVYSSSKSFISFAF